MRANQNQMGRSEEVGIQQKILKTNIVAPKRIKLPHFLSPTDWLVLRYMGKCCWICLNPV